jgi:predicted amidohydrolase YtcJ
MVTRETAAGGVQGPEHRTTREEALSIYTTGSASMAFEEKVKGSLEVGKLADFVILERDILTVPEGEIKDVTVWKTMLGGRVCLRAVVTRA